MRVCGDYAAQGYAHIERLVPPEVAEAFLRQINADLPGATSQFRTQARITRRKSIDVYSQDYPPMRQFLWGLTPVMCDLTGRDLLPTYDYFRLYQQNDVCRVHSDRPACEHSLSLTLGYSDGVVWPLRIGAKPTTPAPVEDNFLRRAPRFIPDAAGRRRALSRRRA